MWLSEGAPPWGRDNPVRDMPSASEMPAICVEALIVYVILQREITWIKLNKSTHNHQKSQKTQFGSLVVGAHEVDSWGRQPLRRKCAKVGHFYPPFSMLWFMLNNAINHANHSTFRGTDGRCLRLLAKQRQSQNWCCSHCDGKRHSFHLSPKKKRVGTNKKICQCQWETHKEIVSILTCSLILRRLLLLNDSL